MRVFKPSINNEKLRELNTQLRDMGRLLGEVRDADVMMSDIVGPALANADHVSGFDVLEKRLNSQRLDIRAQRLPLLESVQWNQALLTVAMVPKGAIWRTGRVEMPIQSQARQALEKCWENVKARAKRLDRLTVTGRHQLRKDLKKLRYSAEFFRDVFPEKNSRNFIRALKRLQENFGYLNDVATAGKLNAIQDPCGSGSADLDYAIGYVLGWHNAQAELQWATIKRRWKQLCAQPKFWRQG